ncbi:MAG: hypothetical protein QM758_07200 [Armatimonas sp.]
MRPLKRLQDWGVHTPPAPGSNAWYQANNASSEWEVYLEGRTPCAGLAVNRAGLTSSTRSVTIPFGLDMKLASSKVTMMPGQIFPLDKACKVADGYLIGFNNGEFGGGLYWFSADGKKHYEIPANAEFAENTQFLLQRGSELLSLRGLSHLGIHCGLLSRLAQDSRSIWKETPLVDLKDSAGGYCFAGQDLWIATQSQLLKVSAQNKLTVVVEKAFWRGLYPNSMIFSAPNTLYIGIRSGAARVRLKRGSSPEIRLLYPGDM